VKRGLTNTKCLSSTELQTLVNKIGIDKATLTCVRRVHRLYKQNTKFNDGYSLWFRRTLADITSKGGELNVVQNLHESFPGHRPLASSSQPLLEDFCVDTFWCFSVLMDNVINSGSRFIF